MGWNLPPGCHESDIPGNRPEDLVMEAWMEHAEKNGIDPDDQEEFRRWQNDHDERADPDNRDYDDGYYGD